MLNKMLLNFEFFRISLLKLLLLHILVVTVLVLARNRNVNGMFNWSKEDQIERFSLFTYVNTFKANKKLTL